MNIAMLSEGAWGSSIALLLARNGHSVKIWCYQERVVSEINDTHENKSFLPNFPLPKNITATSSIAEAVRDVDWIFEAVPVQFLRESINQAKEHIKNSQKWVLLSKGIEQNSLQFPSQIVSDILGNVQCGVLAGPSFARDVAEKKITAVTVAAADCDFANEIQKLVANDYFRPYLSNDIVGVQVGAALKNVITLGIGMLEGAGYTDNTKAFILTRGLHEMAQLAQKVGGRQETVYGLSGVGDLVLTGFGSLSKNLKVGRLLGEGKSLDAILQETGFIPEGINTVQSVHQLLEKNKIALPICNGIYEVIFNGVPLKDKIKELMSRPLTPECESI